MLQGVDLTPVLCHTIRVVKGENPHVHKKSNWY
jgi:hypothetical protein